MNIRTLLSAIVGLSSGAVSSVSAQQALLIVAPQEFVDELQPLVRFKKATARPTYLKTLSEIYTQYNDPAWDEPERIKRCIADFEANQGVDHVLLAGDVDKIPVRWRWWNRWMPDDPYFEGDWQAQSPGLYYQWDDSSSAPFCSWVDIGNDATYTIDIDVRPISGDAVGRQTRIYYADADMMDSRFRIELRPTTMELRACGDVSMTNYTFALDTWYHLMIRLSATDVQVQINGTPQDTLALNVTPNTPGKIGLGTLKCASAFDNLWVTTNVGGFPILVDDFNDYVADGFHTSITMTERNWAVTDLYYADLYRTGTGPPPLFDDWDWWHPNDLYGEILWNPDTDNCPAGCVNLNADHIDFLPDVRVGRIPASTTVELSRYVEKVMAYEVMTTRNAGWFGQALLFEGSIGDYGVNNDIQTYLAQQSSPAFSVNNYRWSSDLESLSVEQRRALVVNGFNRGAGLIAYTGGHGNVDEWSCVSFRDQEVISDLAHTGKWPVVFAAACLTSKLAPIAPADAYTDVNGIQRDGAAVDCEALPSAPETVAPDGLQTANDSACLGENILFYAGIGNGSNSGAIAYLGERSAGRHWAYYLARNFFKAYTEDVTVGDMWKTMVEEYYHEPDPDRPSITLAFARTWTFSPDMWEEGHMFDEPLKFFLFGDPSVVVGGAFNDYRSGPIWDFDPSGNGPWHSFKRYRVVGDVSVPAGRTLTVLPGASVLVEAGRRITGLGAWATEGVYIAGSASGAVHLLSLSPDPQVDYAVQGIRANGGIRLRNGGQLRLY